MDTQTRYVIGLAILLTIQVVLGSTVVYFVRRRNRVEPLWSWRRAVVAFCVLGVIVTGISFVPGVGGFAALIVSFIMGISVFAVSAVISSQLQVDLLGLRT